LDRRLTPFFARCAMRAAVLIGAGFVTYVLVGLFGQPARADAGIPLPNAGAIARPVVTPPLPAPPALPSLPALPATPTLPVAPTVPRPPALPTLPSLPALPAVPTAPPLPALPAVPALPELPALPGAPAVPVLPVLPALPTAPVTPVALPAVPALPTAPVAPSTRAGMGPVGQPPGSVSPATASTPVAGFVKPVAGTVRSADAPVTASATDSQLDPDPAVTGDRGPTARSGRRPAPGSCRPGPAPTMPKRRSRNDSRPGRPPPGVPGPGPGGPHAVPEDTGTGAGSPAKAAAVQPGTCSPEPPGLGAIVPAQVRCAGRQVLHIPSPG
jgi:hypothetical protein